MKILLSRKMYMLVHLIDFGRQHHFIGRGSAEGFEGKHWCMAQQKAMVSSMVSDADRIGVISRRQQLILDPAIMTLVSKFGKPTGRVRGPYTRRGHG